MVAQSFREAQKSTPDAHRHLCGGQERTLADRATPRHERPRTLRARTAQRFNNITQRHRARRARPSRRLAGTIIIYTKRDRVSESCDSETDSVLVNSLFSALIHLAFTCGFRRVVTLVFLR